MGSGTLRNGTENKSPVETLPNKILEDDVRIPKKGFGKMDLENKMYHLLKF